MDEYIERETIKAAMIHYGFKSPDMTVTEFVEDELPAADVAPVLHGLWEYDEPTINTYGMVKCTVCNWWSIDPYVSIVYHYCPNCGARMAEDIDEQKK